MERRAWLWRVSVLTAGLILVFSTAAGLIYRFGGLKYYLRAITYINSLPEQTKKTAGDEFYGDQPNVYTGTLAGVWSGKVWVWGRQGLRYFSVDKNSTYSFTNGCTRDVLHPADTTKAFTIQRQVYFDLASWQAEIEPGDYIAVLIAAKENGGTAGNLREAYVYNWWSFMQKDMQTECAK